MSAVERHPIEVRPALSVETRLALLEEHLAQLWDQVWWLSISPEERAAYMAQGFDAPIERFYRDA